MDAWDDIPPVVTDPEADAIRNAVPSVAVRRAVERYVQEHLYPGGFVASVLANDLWGASQLADKKNAEHLTEIARWVQRVAPGECRGSFDAVEKWIGKEITEWH